ncbi:MAG: helix-turn-helix domain-containing protein [Vicinamibacterales bacterium]|nr:helix-turn-helix domain-containing protein [Vicinamibacterales bacterium]
MGRRAPTFELLPRQRAILERLNRQRTLERRLAERVQVVLWSAAGKPSVEQAAALGVDPQRILRWRHRWGDESGLLADAERCEETSDEKLEALVVEVLSDEERSGSPGKFSAEQLARIISLACEDPTELELPITHWAPRELALEAQRRGIVPSISPRHLARFFGGGGSPPASLAVLAQPEDRGSGAARGASRQHLRRVRSGIGARGGGNARGLLRREDGNPGAGASRSDASDSTRPGRAP